MRAQTDIERSIWVALRDAHDALLIVAEGDLPEGLVDAAGFQELVAGAALRSVKEALNLHLFMGLPEPIRKDLEASGATVEVSHG